MVVLTFLKFLKPNSNTSSKLAATTTTVFSQTVLQSATSDHHLSDDDYDDDDDSFFELELELASPSQQQLNQTQQSQYNDDDHDDDHDDEDEIKMFKKPQSPMSVLRGASPNLFKNVMIMMMKKKKNSRVEDFADMDSVSSSFFSPKRIRNDSDSNSDSSFTVKFKIEDGSIVPKLTRTQSSNSNSNTSISDSTSPKFESRNVSFAETSKRFSKDTVQNYLNSLIKNKSNPNKYKNGEKNNGSCSPLMKEKEEKQSTSRFKAKCKQLGKCKLASAVVGVSSPASFPARNDFPADGIEGAILHCKRSLTSSIKGYSSLSRCSSDPSYEKSIQVAEVCR